MKKLVLWTLYPFIFLFILWALVTSYVIDFLDDMTGYVFYKIHALDEWANYEKKDDKDS